MFSWVYHEMSRLWPWCSFVESINAMLYLHTYVILINAVCRSFFMISIWIIHNTIANFLCTSLAKGIVMFSYFTKLHTPYTKWVNKLGDTFLQANGQTWFLKCTRPIKRNIFGTFLRLFFVAMKQMMWRVCFHRWGMSDSQIWQ